VSETTLVNPADESVIGTVRHTTLEEVDAAVERAVVAQRSWAALAPVDRARALRRFAATVDTHVDELAQLEVRNSGHPIGAARWEAGNVRDVLDCGAVLYGGNFAVRRTALAEIGGFDTSIEFHGEDTNLGRRLHRVGRVVLSRRCVMHTSARRYTAMGTLPVLRLYARNFCHEVLWHRPADSEHLDVRT